MAKHPTSLTNIEVGVIRNLLLRPGAKGQTIVGQINARRRQLGLPEINAARVSEINTNHERYSEIEAVTNEEVQNFFAELNNPTLVNFSENSYVSKSTLNKIFRLKEGQTESLEITETDKIECKESFSRNFFSNCIKTIAAFANNRGGYIVFGVKDSNWQIAGINKTSFEGFDQAKLSNALNDCMSCEIRFEMGTLSFGDKTIGVLYIHSANVKPVIFISDKNGIATGDIYYRYPGANRRIAPAELQQIIVDQATLLSQSVLGKHLSNIMNNGINNSAILNLTTGEVDGKGGKFVIDGKVLPEVAFLKEGEFVEKSGAPALTVVGEVKETIVSKLDRYPFSSRQVWEAVKAIVPDIKQNQFYRIINDSQIKSDRSYSDYSFPTAIKQQEFDKTGIAPNGATVIYNQAAIDFLVSKSKELLSQI